MHMAFFAWHTITQNTYIHDMHKALICEVYNGECYMEDYSYFTGNYHNKRAPTPEQRQWWIMQNPIPTQVPSRYLPLCPPEWLGSFHSFSDDLALVSDYYAHPLEFHTNMPYRVPYR